MTWTVKQSGPMISLTPDGSTNFDWATYFPNQPEGVRIEEIQVYFSAANDVVAIRTHATDGALMFKYTTLDGSSVAKRFFKGLFKPVIVNTDLTMGTAGSVRILIQTTTAF